MKVYEEYASLARQCVQDPTEENISMRDEKMREIIDKDPNIIETFKGKYLSVVLTSY